MKRIKLHKMSLSSSVTALSFVELKDISVEEPAIAVARVKDVVGCRIIHNTVAEHLCKFSSLVHIMYSWKRYTCPRTLSHKERNRDSRLHLLWCVEPFSATPRCGQSVYYWVSCATCGFPRYTPASNSTKATQCPLHTFICRQSLLFCAHFALTPCHSFWWLLSVAGSIAKRGFYLQTYIIRCLLKYYSILHNSQNYYIWKFYYEHIDYHLFIPFLYRLIYNEETFLKFGTKI